MQTLMMKNSRLTLATLCSLFLCTVFVSGCATTKTPASRAQRAGELFDDLDTNHDGFLTRAELAAGLRYAGMKDLDPNLVIGLQKSQVVKKRVKASRRLSEGEIQKLMSAAFQKRDEKLDQRLSKDEFKKLVVERPADASDDPWEPFM